MGKIAEDQYYELLRLELSETLQKRFDKLNTLISELYKDAEKERFQKEYGLLKEVYADTLVYLFEARTYSEFTVVRIPEFGYDAIVSTIQFEFLEGKFTVSASERKLDFYAFMNEFLVYEGEEEQIKEQTRKHRHKLNAMLRLVRIKALKYAV